MKASFDKSWDRIYDKGLQLNKYPFLDFVTFYHYFKKNKKNKINFLEIGCGFGNNLDFVAKFSDNIYGIDASKPVIKLAKKKFYENNININLFVQDFTNIKFKNNFFDFVLNREALTTVNYKNAFKAVKESSRVLKKNGFMYSTFVSNLNTYNGTEINDITINLKGNYSNVKSLRFYNIFEIRDIFEQNNFKIESLQLVQKTNFITKPIDTVSYWVVISKKIKN